MGIEKLGYRAVYRMSGFKAFNRAADWVGNKLQGLHLNYALGATRAAAALHCAKNTIEIFQALHTLRGLVEGKTYSVPMLYDENYKPPKGALVGNVGYESRFGTVLMYQQYYIGKRPERVRAILEAAMDRVPYLKLPEGADSAKLLASIKETEIGIMRARSTLELGKIIRRETEAAFPSSSDGVDENSPWGVFANDRDPFNEDTDGLGLLRTISRRRDPGTIGPDQPNAVDLTKFFKKL